MPKLVSARAWCNNEVAYLAWRTDGPIQGCLGFMITRIHLDAQGQEIARRNLPTWVAFKTQSNPDWEEQDTSVWPIQKFSWRDLTLRRSRDSLVTRADDFQAMYEITPVGLAAPGRARPAQRNGATRKVQRQSDSIVHLRRLDADEHDRRDAEIRRHRGGVYQRHPLHPESAQAARDRDRQGADESGRRSTHQNARRSDSEVPGG